MTGSDAPSLPDLVHASARRHGRLPALVRTAAAGGRGFTYEELSARIRSGATHLRGRGLVPGDRVLLVSPPGPETVAALLAVLEARLVAVPLPPDVPVSDAFLAFVDARAAVAPAANAARFGATFVPLERLLEPRDESVVASGAERGDLALLAFTSGSTARPRAVELTHENLLADLASLRALRGAETSDAFLSMLPTTHLFELVCGTLGPLACGARVVYPGTLLPNRVVDALRDESITHAMAVPLLLAALYAEVRSSVDEAHALPGEDVGETREELAAWIAQAPPSALAALREAARRRLGPSLAHVVVGGAAVDAAWTPILASVGVALEVGYGLTEAGPVVSLGAAGDCPAGSVGRPLPGVDVRIGADDEVLVRGRNVTRGYFRDPAATAAAFVDGFLRTGDRGRLDAQGNLHILGRIKEAMVSATGETVWPDEAEPCYASPQFAEWCVVPVPDADGNDVATLVVVAADPAAKDDAIAAEAGRLRAAAPSRLRFASMRRVAGPLPRTATGKVRRRALGESMRGIA